VKNILYHSFHTPNPRGNGGNRRTAQITDILKRSNFGINFLNEIDYRPKKFSSLPKGISAMLNYNFPVRFRKKNISLAGHYYQQLIHQLNSCPKSTVLIWESNIHNYFLLPLIAKKMGIKTIGVPQNIESLVPNQKSSFTDKESPDWFLEEINYFRSTEKVFTISKEEKWLFNLFNIDADYLPYYPVKDMEVYYEGIRKLRSSANFKNNGRILMVGSGNNPPTYLGMKEVLKNLLKYDSNITIDIAGFATQKLQQEFTHPNYHFHGPLAEEVLYKMMVDCKFILNHQKITTGALTKIPELLIAGIPVVANFESSRSYYNIDGVYTYTNFEELGYLAKNETFYIPEKMERPDAFERNFIQYVSTII
jgi:hypothetical protein